MTGNKIAKKVALGAGTGILAFRASVNKAEQKDQEEPLDPLSEKLLKALPEDMRTEMSRILRQSAAKGHETNPLDYAFGTREMALRSLHYSTTVCVSVGVPISILKDLSSQNAVAAIESQLGIRWSHNTIQIHLETIHRLNVFCYGECNELVSERRDFHAKGEKRDLSDRVFSPEEYRRAAVAMGRLAEIFAAAGHRRVTTMHRGAALLALASVAHARAGEYARLNVDHVTPLFLDLGCECLSVTITMTKTDNDRVVNIYDSDIKELIEPLRHAPKGTPLFRSAGGSRLVTSEITHMLQDLGALSVGKHASANILRKSAMPGRKSLYERACLLGQADTSRVAEENYLPDMRGAGKTKVSNANELARNRVVERRAKISKGKPGE